MSSNPARYDNRSDPHWFRAHLSELQQLPDAGCCWQWGEIGVSHRVLEGAWRRDVIYRVDRDERLWAVRPGAWDMIETLSGDQDPEFRGQVQLNSF